MNFEADFQMLIGGALLDSGERIEVVNPATGEIFATAPDCTDALLDLAVEVGRKAFKLWRATSIPERQACLYSAAEMSKVVEQVVATARQLETGTVWINQNLALRLDTPFAGHKQSGFGVENGMKGKPEYMSPQSVYIPTV